jgi:hypothetical protein
MHNAETVAAYLDRLDAEFRFDVRLARRVRAEVEDHLWEAVADSGAADAESQAVATFGDPRELAREYAAASVRSQLRRVGVITLVALLGVYAAMAGRHAWYDVASSALTGPGAALAARWVPVDVNAFRLAMVTGVIACGYIGTRRKRAVFASAYGAEARRCAVMSAVAATPLLLSVVMDSVFTSLRVAHAPGSAGATLPILSVGLEIVLIGTLMQQIWAAATRIKQARAMLQES